MTKKRLTSGLLAVLMIAGLALSTAGCALVSVNPERDNAQIVAEIDGQQITKESFNNYFAYAALSSLANSQELPTGKKLTTYREELLDSLVMAKTYEAKGRKDKVKVDEKEAQKDSDTSVDSLKQMVGDGRFESVLKNNNVTEESFRKFMKEFAVTNAYADEVTKKHDEELKKDPDKVISASVGTVGGEDVTRGEYDYYYIQETFTAYMTTGAALGTDDDTVAETNEKIFAAIAEQRGLAKYAEANDIKVTKEDVESAVKTKESTMQMLGLDEESLKSFLESYYLSEKKYKEYQTLDATADATEKAIKAKIGEGIEVTDKEMEKYFKDNKDSYSTEESVSAMHILTKDEAYAKEIYNKVKGAKSKDEFKKFVDEYAKDAKVEEATDLNSFGKGKMVKEFENTAFAMDKNTVSEPVKTEFGYHVIYVYDKTAAGEATLEDNKDAVEKAVKDEKIQTEYDKIKEEAVKDQKAEYDEIKTVSEEYYEQLKEELGVTIHTKTVK